VKTTTTTTITKNNKQQLWSCSFVTAAKKTENLEFSRESLK